MSNSILTNSAAMTALQTLRNVSASLDTAQKRISTGYRVATASDNSAYWSIATSMRADNAALSAVSDSLGLSAATVDTVYTALTAVVGDQTGGLTKLQALLVEAKTAGIDRAKIQADITQIQQQMKSTADAATFNGENWLHVDSSATGYNATKSVVSSFSRTGDTVKISTIDVGVDSIKLYDDTAVRGAATTGDLTIGGTGYMPFTYTPTGGTAQTFDVWINSSSPAQDAANGINALNIDGLTAVAVDGIPNLRFANRSAGTLSLYGMNLVGPGNPMSDKGILDRDYDYFDGNVWAWRTTTVNDIDIGSLTDAVTDQKILDQYIAVVVAALGQVTQAAADLGAVKTRINSNADFVKSLMDSVTRGVGQLVDADMNAESTRLQALQVQQQLGIQALSIANQNSQSILPLFKG